MRYLLPIWSQHGFGRGQFLAGAVLDDMMKCRTIDRYFFLSPLLPMEIGEISIMDSVPLELLNEKGGLN